MFEDSTFESAGRIKSKSKYWMMVTFITNGSILLLLILIPLIYPEALPKAAMLTSIELRRRRRRHRRRHPRRRRQCMSSMSVGDDEQPADGTYPHSARHQDGGGKGSAADLVWRSRHGRSGRKRKRHDGQHLRRQQQAQGAGRSSQESQHLSRRGSRYAAAEDHANLSAHCQGRSRLWNRGAASHDFQGRDRSPTFALSAVRPCCNRPLWMP